MTVTCKFDRIIAGVIDWVEPPRVSKDIQAMETCHTWLGSPARRPSASACLSAFFDS
jgi:hypothetical protein